MHKNLIRLSIVIFSAMLGLSLSAGAQAQVGAFASTKLWITPPPPQTESLCGSNNGLTVNGLQELLKYNYLAFGLSDDEVEKLYKDVLSNFDKYTNSQADPMFTQLPATGFCANGTRGIKTGEIGAYANNAFFQLTIGKGGQRPNFPYTDGENPLYYSWQCCKDTNDYSTNYRTVTTCETCYAKQKSIGCGSLFLLFNGQISEEQKSKLCLNSGILSDLVETPIGSGNYTWSCHSQDVKPGGSAISNQYQQWINCGGKNQAPSTNGCGDMNGSVVDEAEILAWNNNWSKSPCKPGYSMGGESVSPGYTPSPFSVEVNQKRCTKMTMSWECISQETGAISKCASKCPDQTVTPISQPATSLTTSKANDDKLAALIKKIDTLIAKIDKLLSAVK